MNVVVQVERRQNEGIKMRGTGVSTLTLLLVVVAVLTLVADPGYGSSLASAAALAAATPTTATFDFDTGLPALSVGQNTPLNQTSGGVTAYFSSPTDPAAFSTQSYETTFLKLSQFSGKYLYPNKSTRTYLDIRFSQQLTSITLTFATIEFHDPGPTNITLTAYMDSTGTTPVGSAVARGVFTNDSYPQSTLSFNSGSQPFNLVRIGLPAQPFAASAFLVDNIIVGGVIIVVDTTPPVTTALYDGLWRNADFSIFLNASDEGSGVAGTYYRLNGATVRRVSVNGQPRITTEGGNNTLEYWSVDNAGNEESHRVLSGIRLDKTPPTGTLLINGNATYAASASVTLNLNAADSLSGVSEVRFSNDGVWDTEAWEPYSTSKSWTVTSGDGSKTVYAQFKDNAGLVSQTYGDSILLDTAPPTVTASSPTSGSEVKSSSVTVTWTGSDETSGIAGYEVRVDSGSWSNMGTETSRTLTGLSDGTHTVEVRATDRAGNVKQATVSFTVNTSLISPVMIAAVIAGVAVVVIVVLYVARTRK